MKFLMVLSAILFSFNCSVLSTPFVQNIYNDTDFIYQIVAHSSDSPCGLFKNNIQLYFIYPKESFTDLILLHQGDKLTLRPVGYFDERQNDHIWFIDPNGQFFPEYVQAAYEAWRFGLSNRKQISQEEWEKNWIGGDILTTIKESMQGYMLHILHGAIANHSHIDHVWLHQSQGVYSALAIEINLQQDENGIKPEINAIHSSRGAICENGAVVEL